MTIPKTKIKLGIIIDTDLKIPPITGVTYRLYYLAKNLQEKNNNVKIFLCNRNFESSKDIKNFAKDKKLEFHIIPEEIFYNPQKLMNIIKKNDINILQVEDPVSLLRFKPISQNLKIPIILIMHDVESTLKELLNFPKKEINSSKKISKLAGICADKIVCMTPLDYKELISKIKISKNKLKLIPNPIDCDIFPYIGPNIKSANILFIGNMYYWPNQNAAELIIKEIRPRVNKVLPRCKFIFIGMTPPNFHKYAKTKNVIFTGVINDINKIFKKTTMALCPVLEGSGMKVKILNYCSSGLPVITTKLGSSGFEKIKSLIVEDDISKYAAIIIKNLSNKKKLIETGVQNRKYIEKYYNINKISNLMINLYNKTIKGYLRNTIRERKKIFNIPLPLYLKENRFRKINNKKYYIIKNGKIISKIKIS